MAPYYSPPNLGVAIAIYFHHSVTIIKQMLGNVDNCFTTATGTNHPIIVDDLFTNLSEPLDTPHTTTWAMSIIGQQMSQKMDVAWEFQKNIIHKMVNISFTHPKNKHGTPMVWNVDVFRFQRPRRLTIASRDPSKIHRGGFNSFENYSEYCESSASFGVKIKKTCLKPVT